MAVSRKRRRRRWAKIGVGALLIALMPTTVAFQDLGALLAHQPGVTARAHRYVIASPFGTIHAATFSLPRPIGTAIPHPPLYALANFDPSDIAASIASQYLGDPNAPLQFPHRQPQVKTRLLAGAPARTLAAAAAFAGH